MTTPAQRAAWLERAKKATPSTMTSWDLGPNEGSDIPTMEVSAASVKTLLREYAQMERERDMMRAAIIGVIQEAGPYMLSTGRTTPAIRRLIDLVPTPGENHLHYPFGWDKTCAECLREKASYDRL